MSSRALRKAQKEREEKDRLQAQEAGSDSGDGAELQPRMQPKKSVFALLAEEGDGDLSGSDEHRQQDLSEDDGADAQGTTREADQVRQSRGSAKAKKRRKKKKVKSTEQEQHASAEDDIDDIDKALQEIGIDQNHSRSESTTRGSTSAAEDACKLLAVDREDLHAQNEMKKLFGRAALQDSDDENLPAPEVNVAGLDRRQRRQLQHNGRHERLHGAAMLALRRNIFVQGKEDWPRSTGGGLGMEIVEKRLDGCTEYRYVHHRTYQEVQQEFDLCVASMNPELLVQLMHRHPTHVSTLLQVSELAKSQRDHAQSRDLLERALFAMGRAVHSTFVKALGEGKARLDFRRPENRELWLGGWRYMQNLAMRGTWRTVYNWAKLLLALSPEDPYAIWLVIDQYALRSKQDLDFLNLSHNNILKQAISDLPSVYISRGLAEYRSGNRPKGQQALYTAVARYPWFVARLMKELDMDAPPAIWGQEPRNEREALHAALYAVRAKDIWNTPEHSALLVEVASAVPTGLQAAPQMDNRITLGEARQVILSDVPQLIELVPRHYTAMYTSASDPLPPPDSIESYDRQGQRNTRVRGTGSEMRSELIRLLEEVDDGEITGDQRNERLATIMGRPGFHEQLAEALNIPAQLRAEFMQRLRAERGPDERDGTNEVGGDVSD